MDKTTVEKYTQAYGGAANIFVPVYDADNYDIIYTCNTVALKTVVADDKTLLIGFTMDTGLHYFHISTHLDTEDDATMQWDVSEIEDQIKEEIGDVFE